MKIKIKESELKQVIKKVISEARNESNKNSVYVEKQFTADIPEIGIVDIIIGGNVSFVDQGIGSYEFWGSHGTQSDIVPELIDYELVGGDFQGIENEVLIWMNQNDTRITEELEEEAEKQSAFE